MRGRKGKVDMVNKKDLRAGVLKMREVAELLSGWADDMERSLGEPPATAGGGSIAGGEVTRNKRSVRGTVAPIEGADKKSGRKAVAADAVVAETAEAAPVDVVSEPASEAAGDAVAPPEPAVQPSFEDVRTLLAAKSAAGCRTQVLALIRSYGAEKLSEVDPAHYADLVVAAAALRGDGDAG